MQHVAALAVEAGLPTGVLTVLLGHGAVTGRALALDPQVRALSFTGSQSIGREVLEGAAASNFKRVSLELGGKCPQILMRDALSFGDELFEEMAVAAFLSSGQNRTAGSRIYVDAAIVTEVTARLVAVAEKLVLGDPADAATQMGPLINRAALARVEGAVLDASSRGAEVLTGGASVPVLDGGHYFPATVVSGAPRDSALAREEMFAPVVTITPFADENEAVALGQRYGVRIGGLRMVARHRHRAPGGPAGGSWRRVGELLQRGRHHHAVWGMEAVRVRQRGEVLGRFRAVDPTQTDVATHQMIRHRRPITRGGCPGR